MNDTPTAAPPREDDASRIAAYFIEAEGGRIVRDMAGHVGDEIHEVLKRHGLTMATAAGAIGVGVLAGVQVLNETLEFAMRSVDTEEEKAAIVAGVTALVGAHIAPSLGTDASQTTVPPAAAPVSEDFLTQLRHVAGDRMATWCGETDLPCGLFHATELGGEVGEVLNVVKKLHREAQGWRGSRATVADLAEEIGDVVVCLDKLAAYYGIDLAQAAAVKFNATSEKMGLPHRLPVTQPTRGFSRFDPPGLWESEPRLSADDAGKVLR
jgi:NTP pyrophosphatase (non-canonical NTP hydrolase)